MGNIGPYRELPKGRPGLAKTPYHLPPHMVLRVLFSMAIGRRRDILADTARLLSPPRPRPIIEGAENVPRHGAFLTLINHYARPGLDAWWPAIAATWALGQARPGLRVRWLMVSEWTWPARRYRYFIAPATRRLFRRLARVYGFILTPPVINIFSGNYPVHQGAAAVRRFLALAREAGRHGEALALAPEGQEGRRGALTALPPGTGRFLVLLAKAGLPFLPVGISERDGSLLVRFGPVWRLTAPDLPKDELDLWAAQEVMTRIACLLPESLWGAYAQAVRERRSQ